MKISVLTPSIRPEYLNITQQTLEKQSFQDFEWLVEVGLHGKGFTLPEDMNKMLRRAQGDIIVSLQDCIELPGDALEQIAALDHTKTAYTYPVGKMEPLPYMVAMLTEDRHRDAKFDWRLKRAERLGDDNITPNMWEADLASAPRQMFFDIGGYDERFCKGWSFDNVEVAWRAEAAGYRFKSSTVTLGWAEDHDARSKHPHRETLPLNNHRANKTFEDARHGKYKLKYL